MSRYRVWVFKRAGRRYYQAQWIDPTTGKRVTRSTGEIKRSEAIRAGARIEAELNSGDWDSGQEMPWAEFRRRYEAEVLPGLAWTTGRKMRSALNAVEKIVSPRYVSSLDASQVSRLAAGLRRRGNAEASVKSMLAAVRSVLTWGRDVGMVREVPKFRMPERVTGMKGRAPSTEEFERIRAKVGEVVGDDRKASWLDLLDGLWWSGLRLGEAMALHWTDDRRISVDLSGAYPMFRIQANSEKGRKFRLLPVAPEFGQWLLSVPEERRRGYVFDPAPARGVIRLRPWYVGKIITSIGAKAGVKVAEKGSKVKFASAHDFRRAFGFRWAARVSPMILQEMMRHRSIQTTQEFYVGSMADIAAAQIWAAVPSVTLSATPEQHDEKPA